MQIRKSKKTGVPAAPATKQAAQRQIAWAAGTQRFQNRDPLYHVTENFLQTFDRIGIKHAQDAATGTMSGAAGTAGGEKKARGPGAARSEGENAPGGAKKRMWTGNTPSDLTAFSETAFQRGKLSASVLDGTGKMMLVSCLKRTRTASGSSRAQEETVFGTGSQVRNVPGHSPDQMVFNRGFAKSALGIVVDTLRDSRRVVESLVEMANGVGELDADSNGALREMYPFLDMSRERELQTRYRARLSHCADPREKAVLQNALVQVDALIAKKTQMKDEFINKLRLISDRASETLTELEAPNALDEIVSSAWGDRDMTAEEEPGRGGGDAPDGTEGTDAPEDLSEPGEGDAEPESADTE